MKSFLEQVVEQIKDDQATNTGEIAIVLPNRRAKVFLKDYFHRVYNQTIWLPEIFSVEDFIYEIGSLHQLDSINLVFEFYEVYRNQIKEPDGFDEFCKWAPTLIQDFNEIDQYMIDAQTLFGFVNETRALEVWNVDGTEITEYQKRYLEFWKTLFPLYSAFKKHLLNKNLSYQGLAFRVAAENVKKLFTSGAFSKWKTIYFAGFNALNKSEETIIDFLLKENKCKLLWDADKYYLNNNIQEAGMFLRRFKEKWNNHPFNWQFDHFEKDEKQIEIIAVPGNVNQVKLTGNLLSELNSEKRYQNTAVVLADESLLIPMLESLPEQVEHVNITMGYPLKNTPLHNLWMALFSLHENGHKFSKSDKKPTFYYKDVLRILQHQSIRDQSCEKLFREISRRNLVYISEKIIIELFAALEIESEILRTIFSNCENNPKKVCKNCLSLIDTLAKQTSKKQKLELEYLFSYKKVFNRLNGFLVEYDYLKDIKTLKTLFAQIVGGETIPFYGEPLKGLQLMGMLETRTLDFDNVILVSANEGTIPAGKSQNSFIPYDIKRKFQLPTHIEKDAIFAYHFYKLIQRASNVKLLYNANTEGLSSGEKSRFITQIEQELPKVNDKVQIKSRSLSFHIPKSEDNSLSIISNEDIRNKLKQSAKKGFSPSGLNTFIRCPLDFYYKYILDLKETEQVEEVIESSSLGTFVHDTLEHFYKPFEGKILHINDVESFIPEADSVLHKQFKEQFSENEINNGKNFLIFNVAKKFVHTFLRKEIDFLEEIEKQGNSLTIELIEKDLRADLEVNGIPFSITGKADRVDRIGNTIRIVDYKTGIVLPKNIKVGSLETITQDEKLAKAFQLLSYALMYSKMNPNNQYEITSGNISFRKLSAWFMSVSVDKNEILTSEILTEFEEQLKQLVGSIFAPEMEFTHNTKAEYCNFCDI